jgi:hypothetical protein
MSLEASSRDAARLAARVSTRLDGADGDAPDAMAFLGYRDTPVEFVREVLGAQPEQ